MLINPEENPKDPDKISSKNSQKSKINDINQIKILPLKLKETLSRNNTNIGILSKRMDSFGEEISKSNKKHRVSFIDQISSKKNIAQIIYIEGQSTARNNKKNDKYFNILMKQETNITEQNANKKRPEEVYSIKRPKNKRNKSQELRKVEKVDQQCECNIY